MVRDVGSRDGSVAFRREPDAASSARRSGLRADVSGRGGFAPGDGEFERRRRMLEEMLDDKTARRDEDAAAPGLASLAGDSARMPAAPFSPFAPALEAAAPPARTDEPASGFDGEHVERIQKLVHDFHLRDPLLASQSLSCRIDFADGFSAVTTISGARDALEIVIERSAEAFAAATGLSVPALEEAVRARLRGGNVRVVFRDAEGSEPDGRSDRRRDET